jgi:hypothetical protein
VIISYAWSGGSGPVRLDEHVRIAADGSVRLWRTVCGERVGKFVRSLDGATVDEIMGLAAAAASAELVGGNFHPGQAEETVSVRLDDVRDDDDVEDDVEDEDGGDDDGRVSVTVADGDKPGGPWGELLARCRAFLDPAAADPVAAIAISGDASHIELRHLGTEQLELDGETVSLSVTAVDAQMGGLKTTIVDVHIDSKQTSAPGWKLDLDVDHGLDAPPGGRLVLACILHALVGGYPKVMAVALPT